MQQLAPSRANALGKRSRMRMGLPEYYNCVLERPAGTAPGYDLIHVDVRTGPARPRAPPHASQLQSARESIPWRLFSSQGTPRRCSPAHTTSSMTKNTAAEVVMVVGASASNRMLPPTCMQCTAWSLRWVTLRPVTTSLGHLQMALPSRRDVNSRDTDRQPV